jgi:hypothetical protein
MEWSKNILTGKKKGQDTKLFQTKINRRLGDEFKIVCVSLGKSQKDLIEVCMLETIKQFKEGRLLI